MQTRSDSRGRKEFRFQGLGPSLSLPLTQKVHVLEEPPDKRARFGQLETKKRIVPKVTNERDYFKWFLLGMKGTTVTLILLLTLRIPFLLR